MRSRISMITLGVADLPRATRFYEQGLGLKRHPLDNDNVSFFALEGTWLALFPWDELAKDAAIDAAGQGFRGVTLAHNVAAAEEVDAVLAEAEAAGATIVKAATEPPWGGRSGYFADLDGHLWEVAWQPDLPLA